MSPMKIETPGLEKASIPVSPEWKITHHRLFNVSPDEAENVKVIGKGVTIWNVCFLEDLLQVANDSKGLLLDVGWYPHADPKGSYRLLVIRLLHDGQKGQRSLYDWANPMVDEQTRSLNDLLRIIDRIVRG